jgi:hypothetical protein
VLQRAKASVAAGSKTAFRELDELLANVNFANDEGDPGMGLEFAQDMFAYDKLFHTEASARGTR